MKVITNRLLITNFNNNHLNDFISFFTNKENTKYLFLTEEQRTPKGATELLHYIINNYNTDSHIHSYAILDKKTGKFIGSCGFSPLNDSYECYYSIEHRHCGNGYATEALDAIVNYCFNEQNIRKIIANIIPENIASEKVAINCGFKYIKDDFNRENNQKIKIYQIES